MSQQAESIQPDLDVMLDHLDRHFGNMTEGKIEIATGKKPTQAQLFGLDQIEDAAEYAYKENLKGNNVYFGVAPRKEDIAPFGRAPDADCLPAHHVWVDLDDPGSAEKAAERLKSQDVNLVPSYSIITGRHPHVRAQFFFELEEPLNNPSDITEVNKRLASNLGGDNAVTNISRVMRVAGSVAWPVKDGRVPEQTKYQSQSVQPYSVDRIKRLMPAPAPVTASGADVAPVNEGNVIKMPSGPLGGIETVIDGREEYMRDCVEAAFIEAVGRAGATDVVNAQTVFDLAWPIFSTKVDMTRPGHNTPEEMQYKCNKIIERFTQGRLPDLPDIDAVKKAWLVKNPPDHSPEEVIKRADEMERLFPLTHLRDVTNLADVPQLVRGTLTEGGMSVIYGDSNVGKSFWALDLAMCVATGAPWCGHQVVQGAVVYVAMEGGGTFQNRMLAWKRNNSFSKDAPFAVIPASVNMLNSEDEPAMLLATIRAYEKEIDVPVRLVIIDTLARAMAGGNENAGEDMAQIIRNTDALRTDSNAHVMLVHHTGKDQTRGARGHSSLRAATDTEIELEHAGFADFVHVNVKKQRDLEGGQYYSFKLDIVQLGTDQYGAEVTSCVVIHTNKAKTEGETAPRHDLSPMERKALEAITDTLIERGEMRTIKPSMPQLNTVSLEDARIEMEKRGNLSQNPKSAKAAWSKAKNALKDANLISEYNGLVWLIKDKI